MPMLQQGQVPALRWRPSLLLVLAGASAMGCGDALMDRALLEGPRVLGARSEATNEPERASVAPGERARVTWLVAAPEGPPAVQWQFGVCEAEATVRGVPYCAAAPFAFAASAESAASLPILEFDMPAEDALLGKSELLVYGAICFGSDVIAPSDSRDLASYRCSESGHDAKLVTTQVTVGRESIVNHNPNLSAAELTFDGKPWAPWPVDADTEGSCDEVAGELPRVVAKQIYSIGLEAPAADREAIERVSARAPGRETYQLSHVVSDGHLERPFSVVDDDVPDSEIVVQWTAPDQVPSGGKIVRFYFVARDLRGGTDFRVGAVCVQPD